MQGKLGQDRPSRVERPLYISSNFLQWGNVYEWPGPLCQHGMVCSERKVKKDGPNQNRMLYNCPKEDACVSSSGSNKRLVQLKMRETVALQLNFIKCLSG